jgi:hypothetical protein
MYVFYYMAGEPEVMGNADNTITELITKRTSAYRTPHPTPDRG